MFLFIIRISWVKYFFHENFDKYLKLKINFNFKYFLNLNKLSSFLENYIFSKMIIEQKYMHILCVYGKCVNILCQYLIPLYLSVIVNNWNYDYIFILIYMTECLYTLLITTLGHPFVKYALHVSFQKNFHNIINLSTGNEKLVQKRNIYNQKG